MFLNTLLILICMGAVLMVLERIFPDQKLPFVPDWWQRIALFNAISLATTIAIAHIWETHFAGLSFYSIGTVLPGFAAGLFSYIVLTFWNYWWHRLRHDSNRMWLLFHQVHHSPQRIETITSFYKHPLEAVCNVFIFTIVNHVLLGVGPEGSAWTALFAGAAEFFYHMNIRTPHWIGYFIQRPEMHRVHHQKGRHYNNFADLPIWDILFQTYQNPTTCNVSCGFTPEREQKLREMLLWKNVNKTYKQTPLLSADGPYRNFFSISSLSILFFVAIHIYNNLYVGSSIMAYVQT